MPYTSTTDVPKHVPEDKRKQWLEVFNSVYKRTDDEGKAMAQANAVIKKEYWGYNQFSPEEVNYDPLGALHSADVVKGCVSCHWFISPNGCTIVYGDISPTGLSDRWEAKPEYHMEPMPVIIVDADSKEAVAKTLARRVADGLVQLKSKLLAVQQSEQQPFILFKDAAGNTRFLCTPTNAYKDREAEIIVSSAHKEYVSWVDQHRAAMPELWLWHTPGSKCGKVDWLDYDASTGFLCASGTIDKEYEGVLDRICQADVAMSHGFIPLYGAKGSGHIIQYRTFEISVLPRNKAANAWTNFRIVDGTNMALTAEKRKWLEESGVPTEHITAFETSTKELAEKLKAGGVEFKEVEDVQPNLLPQFTALQGAVGDLAVGLKAITDVTTAQQTQQAEIAESLKAISKQLEDVNKDIDTKVEEHYKARIAAQPGGFDATKVTTNVVNNTNEGQQQTKENNGEFYSAFMGELTQMAGVK